MSYLESINNRSTQEREASVSPYVNIAQKVYDKNNSASSNISTETTYQATQDLVSKGQLPQVSFGSFSDRNDAPTTSTSSVISGKSVIADDASKAGSTEKDNRCYVGQSDHQDALGLIDLKNGKYLQASDHISTSIQDLGRENSMISAAQAGGKTAEQDLKGAATSGAGQQGSIHAAEQALTKTIGGIEGSVFNTDAIHDYKSALAGLRAGDLSKATKNIAAAELSLSDRAQRVQTATSDLNQALKSFDSKQFSNGKTEVKSAMNALDLSKTLPSPGKPTPIEPPAPVEPPPPGKPAPIEPSPPGKPAPVQPPSPGKPTPIEPPAPGSPAPPDGPPAPGLGDTSINPTYYQNVKGLHQNPADTGTKAVNLEKALRGDDFTVGLSTAQPNEKGYNYPIQTTDGTHGTATITVTKPDWSYPKGTTSLTVPIPKGGFTPADGTDGHLQVIDSVTKQTYDFWQLKQGKNGEWTTSSVAISNTDSTAPRGANAWGVAGAVGDVTAQELESGKINHALALGVEQSWVNTLLGDQGPGNHTDGNVVGAPLSENGKIALKLPANMTLDDFNLTTAGKAIFGALENYGGFLVGKGPNNNSFNAYTTGVSGSIDLGPGAEQLKQYMVYYQ